MQIFPGFFISFLGFAYNLLCSLYGLKQLP